MATAKPATAPVRTLAVRIAINTAPAWRPAPKDIVIGDLIGVRKGIPNDTSWDKNGTPEDHAYPVLVLDTYGTDGKPSGTFIALHCFHTLLRDEVLKMLKGGTLTIGGTATFAYLGKRNDTPEDKADGKNPYHHYYVEPGDGSDQAATTTEELNDFPF